MQHKLTALLTAAFLATVVTAHSLAQEDVITPPCVEDEVGSLPQDGDVLPPKVERQDGQLPPPRRWDVTSEAELVMAEYAMPRPDWPTLVYIDGGSTMLLLPPGIDYPTWEWDSMTPEQQSARATAEDAALSARLGGWVPQIGSFSAPRVSYIPTWSYDQPVNRAVVTYGRPGEDDAGHARRHAEHVALVRSQLPHRSGFSIGSTP